MRVSPWCTYPKPAMLRAMTCDTVACHVLRLASVRGRWMSEKLPGKIPLITRRRDRVWP
jgi:hypothetical protein